MSASCLLLEMLDDPDCRFVAAWLFRAARAQRLWERALDDCEFANDVGLLHADGIPDIAARARQIFGELEHQHRVAVIELHPDDCFIGREIGLLERLGFLARGRCSYSMALPKEVDLSSVRRAALEVASTTEIEDGLEVIHPERLLQMLPKDDAESLRARLIALRRFDVVSEHETRMSNAGQLLTAPKQ